MNSINYLEYQKNIGRRIKEYRINIGMKQKELEDKSGVSLRSISRIEKGESTQLETLIKILIALGLDNNIDLLIPDQTIRPSYYLENKSNKSQRVRSKKQTNNFVWGEDK